MKNLIQRIEEFHVKFGIPVGKVIGDTTRGQQDLHYTLMLEELNEYKEAVERGDIVGVADGLGDVLFVLVSSLVAHGLQGCFGDIINEICDSNMSKLGEDGKPIYRADGKIMKGKDYFAPRLKEIINRHIELELIKNKKKTDDTESNKK